jgi:23S rRNA (uracil1939-C5)-methyltransferase
LNTEKIFEIILTADTYGGEALGRLPDGRAVFVPFAMAGESVRLRLVNEKRGYAHADLLEVLSPAPERISPRCSHFGTCGGCHYQHMPYPVQLATKASILDEQIRRIGGLVGPPSRPVVASPVPFNYRNHIQFHLTSNGRLGFFDACAQEVIPVQECHLPEEAISLLWPQLDFESMPEIERVGLRLGYEEDLQLILESQDVIPPEILIEDLPISAVHLSPAGTLVLAGSESVFFNILGRPFRVSAGSFFQVNTPMAVAMVEHMLDCLPLSTSCTILEVYCGVGLFSAFLAGRCGRLVGIESSSSACEDFAANLDEFDNVELYEAQAEIVLPQLDLKPDVILVDPPRSGIDRRSLDGLLALESPHLVYVSCDPSTLGRDARRLAAAGYRLKHITPFDLFPQTYHIESISLWERP